jgi:hypothetical protein
VKLVQMKADAGERLPLPAKDGLQHGPDDRARKSDVERSQRSASRELGQLGRSIDPCEDVTRVLVKGFTRRCESDAALRSREQVKPELPFERADLLAQCRLDDMEALGCAAEVHLLRDSDEIPEMAQLHQRSFVTTTRFNGSVVTDATVAD